MASMKDVVAFELRRTLRKRSFWYASFAPVVIILAVFAIEYISNNKAQKNNQQAVQQISSSSKIGILDNSGLISKLIFTKSNVIDEPTTQAGINGVKSGNLNAFFYYPRNVASAGITVYTQDTGISTSSPYSDLASSVLEQSAISVLNAQAANTTAVKIIQQSPSITTITYKNGQVTNSLADIIAPGVFMIVFLVLIVLLIYTMINSTTEEKENRVAEILLTSISSRTVILGKIVSIFYLALVQILVIVIPLLITYSIFKSHISLPGGVSLSQIPLHAKPIIFGALFLAGGLTLYTGLLVGLGAMFPGTTEANRYTGVGIIWAFVPIYALTLILSSPDSLIVNVFTYFPLTAPTTVLLRNALSNISTTQEVVALIITIISAIVAIGFAVRAFRYGALEYGRRISFKELLH